MLLGEHGKKGYMQCLNLLLLLCFLDNELQHTYQILISSEDKQERMYELQRAQQDSQNTGPSSSHHGPASNFGFNSSSTAKGKLPILV